ncbi:MAG: type II secretion system protein [Patescibacteria group bacterium]|nr:type II secretion system protein [Patescibacteria group bacterium]
MINIFKNNKKGFTLLEMLISASIFAITVVIGVDIFFGVARMQKRTTYVQNVQADARYVLEEMAKQLRQGMINYQWYDKENSPVKEKIPLSDLRDNSHEDNKILATKDLDGNQFFFERVPEGTLHDGSVRYVMKVCSIDITGGDDLDKCDDRTNNSSWQIVTPNEINVDKFYLFVSPSKDPFVLDENSQYEANQQPMVTIVFHTSTDRPEKEYQIDTKLSTTISSRIYKR